MSQSTQTLGIGIFGAGNVSSGHLNAYLADLQIDGDDGRTLRLRTLKLVIE